MKTLLTTLVILIIFISPQVHAQENDLELFIIDSFVTPEEPHTFSLNFFTSLPVISKIKINNEFEFNISDEFTEDHSIKIDFSQYKFVNKNIPYVIISQNEEGKIIKSEEFDIILPYDEFIQTKEGSNPISTILLGVFLYSLPSPNLAIIENKSYFSISKEIPIITFYGSGYNYPNGNISFEYSHFYNASISDLFRLGYKQIIPIKGIEYISPGISGFTNFKGFNGIGTELSIGLFKVYDVFTVYSRYRFNFKPNDFQSNIQEISIGLYSNFFTLDY